MHPSQIPVSHFFDVKDYAQAWEVVSEMLSLDLSKEIGFKILMPKDEGIARKIGYTIVNELSRGLRAKQYHKGIRYFIYHHDAGHYAMVIASEDVVAGI